ncbi:hypothetical protein PRUPE_7G267100 [Prunus persica]|uniref:Uncharacterized protein n=1 Tax=Prunus persica TaxID=3760 RepID=A0A251NHK4_PRUPE|nr:hypothetical protein PRUPE_7G267100 [Prunus persica]ONH98821.1 hypothetical protein PRUPE_7G267100 [Prunus persica]
MAKENESASQATVNGDNTLTRSTMSSIGIGRGCVLLRETHRECTRHRWCRPRVPHSWRDDRLVLIMVSIFALFFCSHLFLVLILGFLCMIEERLGFHLTR